MCYYYEGEHCIRDCEKSTKDKAKYKLNTADLARKYKQKFRQAARKGNTTVNEVSSVQSQPTQWNKQNKCFEIWDSVTVSLID